MDRKFSTSRTVRVADCNSRGEVRIDALARYLQDIGYDDTNDIGVGDGGNWVARSINIKLDTADLPTRNDVINLTTYCAGVGRAFAQRNVDIVGQKSQISTSTIWVHVDNGGKPTSVPQWLNEAYPNASKITAKKNLPVPNLSELDSAITIYKWPLRATDFDINGHINNSVAFAALYEIADQLGADNFSTVTVEFHRPIGTDEKVELLYQKSETGFDVWMKNGNNIAASMRWDY